MAAFQPSVRVAGGTEDVSWRERGHDDLVLAVALAASCKLQGSVGYPSRARRAAE